MARSHQRTSTKMYLVAHGGRCLVCRPHGWRAFCDPQEHDCRPPWVRVPIYQITARTKVDAVRRARSRFAAEDAIVHEHLPDPPGRLCSALQPGDISRTTPQHALKRSPRKRTEIL